MEPTRSNSQDSFNSDIPISQLSLTQSTRSVDSQHPRLAQLSSHSDPHDSSMELPAVSVQPPPEFELGFSNGFGLKSIAINQSKLKKARKFFEDTQLQPSPTASCFVSKINREVEKSPQPVPDEMSMPCFKTMGRGFEIKVSAEAREKAQRLLQSVTKPTKVKKGSKRVSQDLIKTVNVPKTKELIPPKQRPAERRSSFNWESYLREIDKIEGSDRKSVGRKSESQRYQRINLSELSCLITDEEQKAQLLSDRFSRLNDLTFAHVISNCTIAPCILCHISYTCEHIDKEALYSLLRKQFYKPHLIQQVFDALYEQCCFKLMRYQVFWPQLVNKQLNASNLIVEINKRILELQKREQCSLLKTLMANGAQGGQINVVVQAKYHNQNMSIVFLLLSDGWHSVWAVVQAQNLLYEYTVDSKKVRVGSKLCISQWNRHPIGNMLKFCEIASQYKYQTCIEITYNGTILLKPNAKLGASSFVFCRPLSRCQFKGGIIPSLYGTVIRFISIRQTTRQQKDARLSTNVVEMLLKGGSTCLVKFVLGEDSGLADMFRLYWSYVLNRVMLNQDGTLSFSMRYSKYDQVKGPKINDKEGIYPEVVLNFLKNRLMSEQTIQALRQGQPYDVVCNDGSTRLNQNQVKFELEGQQVPKGTVLYQQVCFSTAVDGVVVCTRGKYSSRSSKLPRIYNAILSL